MSNESKLGKMGYYGFRGSTETDYNDKVIKANNLIDEYNNDIESLPYKEQRSLYKIVRRKISKLFC